MSDPSDRRSGTGGEPQPTPPPNGPASRRDALIEYFRRYKEGYTRLALEQGARRAGYSDNDIAAAWTLIDMEDGGTSPASRFSTTAKLIIVGLYLATFALFIVGSDMNTRTSGVGGVILALTLLVVGFVALVIAGRAKVVSSNPVPALAGLIAVPFILLVIVAGLCVATTSPRFFGDRSLPGPTPAPEEGEVPNDEGGQPPEPAESPPTDAP